MMSKKLMGVLLLVVMVCLVSGAVPESFNVHGKLTNAAGTALSGTYSFNFSVYNVSSGGVSIWNQTISITTDVNGVYNIILSPAGLDFSLQYYLGIDVAGDGEMVPRMNMTTTPYSFRAKNVSVSGVEFDSVVNVGSFNFSVGTTTLFVDVSSGFVGVGTDSPATTLSVLSAGANGIHLMQDSDTPANSGRLFFEGSGGTIAIMNEGNTLRFKSGATAGSASGSPIMILQATGKLGLNTVSPDSLLSIAGNAAIGSTYAGSNAAPTDGLIVEGNVGIGTASPGSTLDVNGSVNISGSGGGLVFPDGSVQTSAGVGASAGAGWSNSSGVTSTALNVNLTAGNLTIGTALFYVDGAGDMVFRI